MDGFYGKLELGNTNGIYDNMRIGADTIALGSGGINSTFIRNVKLSSDSYILLPNSFMSQNFGFYNSQTDKDSWDETKYLTKLNYYSPEFFGFQFGLGITPNVKLKSEYIDAVAGSFNFGSELDLGTFIDYGISYINSFGNLGIAMSIVGENNISNKANKTNGIKENITNKFNSLEFGANINYFGLTIAGSFGKLEADVDDQDLITRIKKDGTYLTYGLAYELSSFSFSLTHFESEYKDYTKFESTSYAIEKNIAKGVSFYVEYTDYISEVLSTKAKNKENSIFGGIIINLK